MAADHPSAHTTRVSALATAEAIFPHNPVQSLEVLSALKRSVKVAYAHSPCYHIGNRGQISKVKAASSAKAKTADSGSSKWLECPR